MQESPIPVKRRPPSRKPNVAKPINLEKSAERAIARLATAEETHRATEESAAAEITMQKEHIQRMIMRDQLASIQTESDDFDYDCIVIIDGHSDIDEEYLQTQLTLDRGEQVTIMLTDPGAPCNASKSKMIGFDDKMDMPPSVILATLNAEHKLMGEDTFPNETDKTNYHKYFKFTSGLISTDKTHYYERLWSFFDSDEDGIGVANIGSIRLFDRKTKISEYIVNPTNYTTTINKTSLFKEVFARGYSRPLLLDVGCARFSSPLARDLWQKMMQQVIIDRAQGKKTLGFGGKRKKTRKLKRKIRKRKLCL